LSKVAIFGIDGASLKLIEEWRDELPVLAEIMRNGVFGELQSTIPPVTAPAWPCMFTGKNPGQIGMYGFTTVRFDGDWDLRSTGSKNYNSCSLWHILNSYGKKVGLLNVPMTYPPHKVDSFMVCGMGSPETWKANYTYPPGLKKELDRVVGGYEIFPAVSVPIKGQEKAYLETLHRAVSKRLEAAKFLMGNFPWDLFVCVFWTLDQVQHFFWHHMDASHPWHYPSEFKNAIKDFYRQIDAAIGELIGRLPQGTDVFIVSDHGFGSLPASFSVNTWLSDNGFLKYKAAASERRGLALVDRAKNVLLSHLSPGLVRLVIRVLPRKLVEALSSQTRQKERALGPLKGVDWSETRAYAIQGMISINLKGREPEGLVQPGEEYERVRDEIIARLEKLADPETKKPLAIKVFKREEIYHGRYLELAPDILFELDDYPKITGSGDSEWHRPAWSGWHAPEGVFLACGGNIKRSSQRLANLRIYDITPTVLHIFGLPVPGGLDGRVLGEIFRPGSEPARTEVSYQTVDERLRMKVRNLKASGRI